MPISPKVIRVNIGGEFLQTAGGVPIEQFNHGFHIIFSGPNSDASLLWQDIVDQSAEYIRDQWRDTMNFMLTRFPQTVRYTNVAVQHLSPSTGLVTHVGVADFSSDPIEFSATNSLPPQCSEVVTLQAFAANAVVPNPSRRRGRMYLPPMASTACDTNGTLSTVAHTELATRMSGFFNVVDANTTVTPDDESMRVCVLSRVDGVAYWVELIRVGEVVDTQRRRRFDIPENYINNTIVRA